VCSLPISTTVCITTHHSTTATHHQTLQSGSSRPPMQGLQADILGVQCAVGCVGTLGRHNRCGVRCNVGPTACNVKGDCNRVCWVSSRGVVPLVCGVSSNCPPSLGLNTNGHSYLPGHHGGIHRVWGTVNTDPCLMPMCPTPGNPNVMPRGPPGWPGVGVGKSPRSLPSRKPQPSVLLVPVHPPPDAVRPPANGPGSLSPPGGINFPSIGVRRHRRH